jgi:type IV pilus assembly protein PilZ
MFLGGESQAEIGAEVVLALELPKLGAVELPGFVRWTAARGFGVQFGLLGARETHAIGGLVRKQPVAS